MSRAKPDLTQSRRVVVKIGSALLVDRHTGLLRSSWLKSLAEDVAWLKGQGLPDLPKPPPA